MPITSEEQISPQGSSAMRDYFEILGVSPEAKPEEVRRAYKKMLKVWDPARFDADPELKRQAEEQTQLVHHAFNAYSSTISISEQFWLHEDDAATQAYRPEKKSQQGFLREILNKRWTGVILLFLIIGSLALPSRYTARAVAEINRLAQPQGAAISREARFYVKPLRRDVAYAVIQREPLSPRKPDLISAAARCDIAALQGLLEEGADTEVADSNGETALLWASKRRCADAARILVERGANVNTRARNGLTPLTWAFSNQSPGLELILARAGAGNPRID